MDNIRALIVDDSSVMRKIVERSLRQAGLGFLKRYPYEASSAALFPFLSSKTEAVRPLAMQGLEQLAGAR